MKLKQPVSRLLGAHWLLLCLPLSAADRVISLSPHTTEMAYAAGLGDKMVAASLYSDYPPAAKSSKSGLMARDKPRTYSRAEA